MQGEGPLKELCIENGIDVKSINSMPWWSIKNNDFVKEYKNISNVIDKDFSEIIDYVKSQNIDIVYTQTIVNPFGAMVAEKLNLPHVWALREYGENDHHLKFIFGFENSMLNMYKTSDFILSVSKSVSKVVLGKNHKNKNVFINYSSIEIPNKYRGKDISIFKNNVINIGIFGSVTIGKNQEDAIKACLKLLDKGYKIILNIVGERDEFYYNKLVKMIDKSIYKNNFSFINHTEKPLEIMSQMDIILSCAISEAMGRTLFEATLLKVPIIYSDVGGAKEIFENRVHGLGYKLHDSNDLADKIAVSIDESFETEKRVKNAYLYVNDRFDSEAYIKPLLYIIKQIQENKNGKKQKCIVEFVLEYIVKKSNKVLDLCNQENQKKEHMIQKKEYDIKYLEELFFNREQQLHEKELEIKELKELADSMRIKNRIKKVFGK
jgi:glycosyltransferase involved in cell wall biosynthesis